MCAAGSPAGEGASFAKRTSTPCGDEWTPARQSGVWGRGHSRVARWAREADSCAGGGGLEVGVWGGTLGVQEGGERALGSVREERGPNKGGRALQGTHWARHGQFFHCAQQPTGACMPPYRAGGPQPQGSHCSGPQPAPGHKVTRAAAPITGETTSPSRARGWQQR